MLKASTHYDNVRVAEIDERINALTEQKHEIIENLGSVGSEFAFQAAQKLYAAGWRYQIQKNTHGHWFDSAAENKTVQKVTVEGRGLLDEEGRFTPWALHQCREVSDFYPPCEGLWPQVESYLILLTLEES